MDQIGEFRVIRKLGQGGFGQVFLCQYPDTGSLCAIKTVHDPGPVESDSYRALRNEVGFASRVDHPNVVRVTGSGRDPEAGLYLVMEFVDGASLRDFLDSQRSPMPYAVGKPLLLGIASGLQAINALLVHRDIHPGNILLAGKTAKITDFGLSKLADAATRTRSFKGIQHIRYRAPESWKGDRNTFLMDVYSAGLVFFEVLAGEHPFLLRAPLRAPDDWRAAHLFGERPRLAAVRPDVPPAVSSLVSDMMAVRAQDRPSWEVVLDTLAHDTEVPSWLDLPGEPGRRAREASARKRALLHHFEKEQEYYYRAACGRFLCELEDFVAEARPHLPLALTASRVRSNRIEFSAGGAVLACELFGRLRYDLSLEPGPVLGGGFLQCGDRIFNIVLCQDAGPDDFGGSWWIYPMTPPVTVERAFYDRLLNETPAELQAHAVRGFSALLHDRFIRPR